MATGKLTVIYELVHEEPDSWYVYLPNDWCIQVCQLDEGYDWHLTYVDYRLQNTDDFRATKKATLKDINQCLRALDWPYRVRFPK